MAQTEQPEENTTQFDRKSGKGLRDGVVSELFTIWDVKPGHEEELRAACERFHHAQERPRGANIKTGLRDERLVLFDGGKRMVWFHDLRDRLGPLRRGRVYEDRHRPLHRLDPAHDRGRDDNAWIREAGGKEKSGAGEANMTDTDQEKEERMGPPGSRSSSVSQIPASGYFNAISYLTHAEIRKAKRVNEAFQQVLDDPDAAEALQHPALKPLLEQAAD